MGIDLLSKAAVQVDSEKLLWEFINLIFKSWLRHKDTITLWSKIDSIEYIPWMDPTIDTKSHFQIIMITDNNYTWTRMDQYYEKRGLLSAQNFKSEELCDMLIEFTKKEIFSSEKIKLLTKQFNKVVSSKMGGVGQGDGLGTDPAFSIIADEGMVAIGFYRAYYSA